VDGCATLEAVAKTAPDVVLSLIDSDATETAYVQSFGGSWTVSGAAVDVADAGDAKAAGVADAATTARSAIVQVAGDTTVTANECRTAADDRVADAAGRGADAVCEEPCRSSRFSTNAAGASSDVAVVVSERAARVAAYMRSAKAALLAAAAAFTAEAVVQAAGARLSEALTSAATSARAETLASGRWRTRAPLSSAAPRRFRLGWSLRRWPMLPPKRPTWRQKRAPLRLI